MARFRYARLKSEKHEITWSFLNQNASAQQTIEITKGVNLANKDTATEVGIGSHVPWIYFELNIAAETITNPKVFHWTISSVPVAGLNSSPALYFQLDRAQIMKRGMEMLPKDVGTVFKRIFTVKIPKIYQRVKDDQKIIFSYIVSSAEPINFCGFAVFKEQV